MHRILEAEILLVTGALLNDFFKESWMALSKQELADKTCRKGHNVDVIVARTSMSACQMIYASWAKMTPMR